MIKHLLICVLVSVAAFGQAQTPFTVTQSAGSATGELRLQERRTNGTNYAGVRAPESVASNIVWTLPAADGTSGQCLSTDGAGVLSFAACAGYWTLSGSDIYRNTGIVTIGHTSPTVRLGQNFNLNYSGNFGGMALNVFSATAGHGSVIDFNKSANGTLGAHGAVASGDTLGFFVFRGSDGTNYQRAAEVIGEVDGTVSSGVVPGRLRLSTASPSGVMTERLRIDKDGLITLNGSVYFTGQFLTPQTISVSSVQNHLTLIQPNSIGAYNPACMVLASSDTVTSAVYGSARICSGYESASFGDDKFAIQTATGSGVYQDAITIKNQIVTLAGDLVATAGSFSLSSGTMAGTMRPLFSNTGSIGDASYRYASGYFSTLNASGGVSVGNSSSLTLDRTTRTSNQQAYWSVGGSTSAVGAWSIGAVPSGGVSTYWLAHNGTAVWTASEGGQVDFSGVVTTGGSLSVTGAVVANRFNATSANPYQVAGSTVIDASRNGSFANLSASGTVTLNGSITGDLLFTSSNTYIVGNSTNYLNAIHANNVVAYASFLPASGVSTVDVGSATRRIRKTYTGDLDITGTVTPPSGTAFSGTKTVRDSAGTGTCTLTFSAGIMTGGTC